MLLLLIACIIYPIVSQHNINKIIPNKIFTPSCVNCRFYNPDTLSLFDSDLSTCKKFGTKNLYTKKIKYDYAKLCRDDESKCGITGRYFEFDTDFVNKKIKHILLYNLKKLLVFTYLFLVVYTYILYFTIHFHIIKN